MTSAEIDLIAADSVTHWVRRLQNGDETAAEHLWSKFFVRLTAVARHRLNGRTGQLADDEDIALSAFNSFCAGVRKGRFTELNDRDSLWRLLLTITTRKITDQNVFDRRKKRDFTRQVTIHNDNDQLMQDLVSREPTPEFAAQFAEEIEFLLESLEHADLRSIALWKMEGYTNDEIARLLQRSVTTVERKLRTIRSIWSEAS